MPMLAQVAATQHHGVSILWACSCHEIKYVNGDKLEYASDQEEFQVSKSRLIISIACAIASQLVSVQYTQQAICGEYM